MNKPATSPRLWAPVHMPKRGAPFINWGCIACTRREAKRLLLEYVRPEFQAERLKNVRFARVTVTEDVTPLAHCAANRDGDCTHAQCPQLRDGEPLASGRHCPLDV